MKRLISTFLIFITLLSANAQIGGLGFWNGMGCDPLFFPTSNSTNIASISSSGWTAVQLNGTSNSGSGLLPLSDLTSGYRGRIVNTFRSKESVGDRAYGTIGYVHIYPETISDKIVRYEVLRGPPLAYNTAAIVFHEYNSACGASSVTIDYFPDFVGSNTSGNQNGVIQVLADDITGNYFYTYGRPVRNQHNNDPVTIKAINKAGAPGSGTVVSTLYPGGNDYYIGSIVFGIAGSGENRYLYACYTLPAEGSSRIRVGIDRFKLGATIGPSEVVLNRPLYDVSTDSRYPALVGGDDNFFYSAVRLGSGIEFYVHNVLTGARVFTPAYPGEWMQGLMGRLIVDPNSNRLYETRGKFYFNRDTRTWHQIF